MVVHPLESSAKHTRSVRGALPSIAVHAAIVLVAVHATAHAAASREPSPPPPIVRFVPSAPLPPVTRASARHGSSDGGRTATPPVHTIPVVWPMTISDRIPTIDPARGATIAIDRGEFGTGVNPGSPFGSGNAVHGSAPYSATDVERPVSPVGDAPTPAYPEALRSSGIRGSVTAEFVVDTTGRVEPGSFRALASDNDLFTAAVREAVLRTRFHPAEASGRRVRQLVQQSFSFVLQ
jgi:protein TonB